MGTAAAFFLQNEDKEIDDDDVELMTYYTTAEEQLMGIEEDPQDEEFETWICDLLDAFDNQSPNSNPSGTNYLQ